MFQAWCKQFKCTSLRESVKIMIVIVQYNFHKATFWVYVPSHTNKIMIIKEFCVLGGIIINPARLGSTK